MYTRATIEAAVREGLAADLAAGCRSANLAPAEWKRLAAGLSAVTYYHPLEFVGAADKRVLRDRAVIAELATCLRGVELSKREPVGESLSAAIKAVLLRHS